MTALNDRGVQKRYADALTKPSDIQGHMTRFVDVVQRRNITKVIELGVRNGMSTIAWLHALSFTDGHLWSVDVAPYGVSSVVPLVIRDRETAERWTFVQGRTTDRDVMNRLPNDAGLVFIDSMHDYETTWVELQEYSHKLTPDGLFLLHDTEWPTDPPPPGQTPEVKQAIEDFMAERSEPRHMYFTDSYGLGVIALDGKLPW